MTASGADGIRRSGTGMLMATLLHIIARWVNSHPKFVVEKHASYGKRNREMLRNLSILAADGWLLIWWLYALRQMGTQSIIST